MMNYLRRILSARNLMVTSLSLGLTAVGLAYFLPRILGSNVAAQSVTDRRLSEGVQQQMRALVEEKYSRSPAQQKLDSQLLYALRMHRGEEIAPGIRQLSVSVEVDSDGSTEVDITAIVGGTLTEDLIALGAELISVYPEYKSIRATVPIDQLEAIAEFAEVRFIQPKQEPQYLRHLARARANGATVGEQLPPGFLGRVSRVRSILSEALSSFWPFDGKDVQSGSKTSEGDATHRANTVRTTLGPNGSGVRIGVISDGVESLAASQAAGDTPADVTVLPGYTGDGDEGTAMLEIVHDVAPGAKLFFATATRGIAGMAQAIRDLRTAGCDIIVDDVIFGGEGPFQDGQAPNVVSTTNGGIIWQAVNDVTAAGTLYFSSAGNEGNKNDNTSGTWQGDFADGGNLALLPGGTVHDFAPGTAFNTITATGSRAALFWSDPLGGSSNDYDLFVLDSAGTNIIGSSTNVQNGTQDPFEVATGTTTNNRVVVLKKTGAANRFLYLENFRGRLNISTEGNVRGHACAANAFSVAATPAASAFGNPPNPTGPFPNPFTSSNVIELFSSDGPRRIFFNANGTPITPGNVTATGGTLRQKPDITAADGVMVTGVGGFPSRFFGTSAAAPHAAAIAGLLKSANPTLTPAQIRTALNSTAIDIEGPGVDRDSGAGIVMAFEALQSVGAIPAPNLQTGTVTATESGGNGNTFIEPGEGATLSVQLLNNGPLAANTVAATLSTLTPGVSVTTPNSDYPNLPATSGSGVNSSLFAFILSPTASCPLRIDFLLTVSFSGSGSPRLVPFSVQTGVPRVTITSTIDTVAPIAGPGFTTTTGLQNLRLNRNNFYTSCGVGKVCPGTTGTGTRRFDAYTFTNCSTQPSCIEAEFLSTCSSPLFVAAYQGAFSPTDTCMNYLGDPGTSPSTLPVNFGFTVPAGATYTIVVSEVNADGGNGCGYTLNLDGLCCQGNVGGCPSVSSLSAQGGSPGNTLTINGANLTGVTGVRFPNRTGGAFSIVNGSQIVTTVPSGTASGPIILSKPGCADVATPIFVIGTGTPNNLLVDDSTFELSFRLSSASENYVNRLSPFGYPATLTGVSLFFTNSAPPVGTPITLLVGSNADGDANIDNTVFQTLATTIQSTGQFVTYNFPATTINSGDFVVGFRLSSTSGQFPAAVDRTLPARQRSYSSTNGTTFSLIDNLGATSAGNLGIRARIGSAACPTATSINPSNAGVGGLVTITGTNFEGISAVKFANNLTAAFNVVNDTTLTATLPNGTVSGPILISKPTCTDFIAPSLTVIQCQTVSGTNVSSGAAGSQVIINGANFTGVSGVKFANNVTATFTVNSDAQITATVPTGAITGPIIISRNGCGDVQTATFTVQGCPTISAISPPSGITGTSVVITGTNFTGVTAVKFGNNTTAVFTVNSNTQITATVPAGATSAPITISKATCTDVQSTLFGVILCPTVSGINPASGAVGSSVVITGANFTSVSAVKFANNVSSIFTINSATQITATVPASAVSGLIVISKPTCADVQTTTFTLSGCPTITTTNPTSGVAGTSVTINGTNLTSVNSVRFANNVSASFTVNNATSISTTVPNGAISGPITISKTGCADIQTALFTVQTVACGPPGELKVDDGTFDTGIGIQGGGTASAVNRLTPPSYPATITGISVFWPSASGVNTGTSFSLLVGVNPGGAAAISGIVLQTIPATVQTLGQFTVYSIPPVTITAGDFVIGGRVTHQAGAFPLAIDTTPTSKRRSYVSEDGMTFEIIDDIEASLAGNFGIRAQLQGANCCHAVTGINPTSGPVGSSVVITGTNFAGATAVKFAGSVSATFTVNSDTQITASVPIGTVTGPITISKPGCPDAQTASFSLIGQVTTVSAASFIPGAVAVESIVAGFGANLATTTAVASTNPLSTNLAGTTVTVRDAAATERLAGLFFVSGNQVNYQVPLGTVDGTAVITVRSGNGAVSTGTLQIARTAPGVFTANASGVGIAAAQIFRLKADGGGGFEDVSQFDMAQSVFVPVPIDLGPPTDQLFLVLYGVGIRLRTALSAVTAQIGGIGAVAEYAGVAPGFIGLDQVNLALSRTLAGRGVISVVLTVDGKTANTVTISVK